MNTLAIITARGGSKRIPRKNIKLFMGNPMLSYAVKAVLGSSCFTEVMVSTEDYEIADVACKYGASVPFMRSARTASDTATTADVLREVHDEYAKRGKVFDAILCVYPCVPFLTSEILSQAYTVFKDSGADALMPVAAVSNPIQRALKKNSSGFLEYREPENVFIRSQDLEPMYHDAGMFYFVKTEAFLKYGNVIVPNTAAFIMQERFVQDIDTMEDWAMAELKYRMIHNV